MFETLGAEQIAKLADCVILRRFAEGDVVIKQGDVGQHEFFVIETGEAVATGLQFVLTQHYWAPSSRGWGGGTPGRCFLQYFGRWGGRDSQH